MQSIIFSLRNAEFEIGSVKLIGPVIYTKLTWSSHMGKEIFLKLCLMVNSQGLKNPTCDQDCHVILGLVLLY